MHTPTEDAFYLEELHATSPQPSFRPNGPAYFPPGLCDVARLSDLSLDRYITAPGPRPAAQHTMNTSGASTDASDSPDHFNLRAGGKMWGSAPDLTIENFFQPHLNSPRPHLWDNNSPLAGPRFLPKHCDSNVHVPLPSRKAAHVSRIKHILTNIAEELALALTEECKHNCVTGCVSCIRAFHTTMGGVSDHVGKTQFSSPRNSHAPRSPGR
jgi:hypothetical protein